MIKPNPEQQAHLMAFYKDWRGVLDQLATAQASVHHWESEAKLKEARFKGAAEFVFGSRQIAFKYDEVTKELTFTQPERRTKESANSVPESET